MIARPVIFSTSFITIVVLLASIKIKANQDNSAAPNNNSEVNASFSGNSLAESSEKSQANGSTTIIFSSDTKETTKTALEDNATVTIAPEVKVSGNTAPKPVLEVNATALVEGNATVAVDNNATVFSEANASAPALSFNASDFFSGFDIADLGDGAMGTQRLVEVKSGRLTPSLAFTMAYNYSSNPYLTKVPQEQDAFNAVFNLLFNMGLGEYAVGDTLLTPALSLMQMRTYSDPVKDYGTSFREQGFDTDLQTAGLMIPILLPRDYTISLGHTYARAINFRTSAILTYSNTPNIALTKMLPLESGDILSFTLGTSYTFPTASGPNQDAEVQQQQNLLDAAFGQQEDRVNLQQSWSHIFNLIYIMPIDEKLTLTPSVALNMLQFVQGSNDGREDITYIAGLNASYLITEWFNVSAAANYTWKRTNDVGRNLPTLPEFENFTGGVTLGFNYSF
jgi:hypothetical protein